MTLKSWSDTYDLVFTCSIYVPYEYAMLGSLKISLYSHLLNISDFVFICGFIKEILLAAFLNAK